MRRKQIGNLKGRGLAIISGIVGKEREREREKERNVII